ncbi:MAG: GNAT family N-acetyltransferase [Hyphomicrobium sp.]|jgi:ribosomal protein S18 acetylase RimI-like enzyme|nr:GNAT family N-acetyltransferase [Hyphomicrobium sp.]
MPSAKVHGRPPLAKPTPLKPSHILDDFNSTEDVLNDWLKKRAHLALASRTATTFVVCRSDRVVGYYSLATGSISHTDSTSNLRRNTPDPIPAIVLARLAVSREEGGRGIGRSLVQDAMNRSLVAARHIAARTLIVHALNTEVADFYRRFGFIDLPAREGSISLHLKLATIAASLTAPK